jgi:hypothetical protein
MGKLVIFYLLVSLAQNEIVSNQAKAQTDDVSTYEYWSTFSETFEKTADYWEAESAALEAESKATDRTNVKEWLEDNKSNLEKKKSKTQC